MSRRTQGDLHEALRTLDGHLTALGPVDLRQAVANLDLPDHLWLAVEAICLPEEQQDSLVQALLRFDPLDVVEFADGSVLLRPAGRKRQDSEITVMPAPMPERNHEAFMRPPFRPAPERRKALRPGR
jgi:hypothetical protein